MSHFAIPINHKHHHKMQHILIKKHIKALEYDYQMLYVSIMNKHILIQLESICIKNII